jgi:nitroreductase
MEFTAVVRKRRMVRSYTDEPVDPEAVRRALEHGNRAPSAGFSQGWAFLLLDTPDQVGRFWDAATPEGEGNDAWAQGMRAAPVVVVPLSCKRAYLDRYAEPDKGWTDRDEARWPAPYWDIDTGMAALLVLLTAVDEGLGACFFGVPPDRIDPLRAEFGVPDDYHPIGAMTLGHPAPDRVRGSSVRGRRNLDTVVHHGGW